MVPVKETISGALGWHGGRVGTRQKHGIQRTRHDGRDAESVGSGGQGVGKFHMGLGLGMWGWRGEGRRLAERG